MPVKIFAVSTRQSGSWPPKQRLWNHFSSSMRAARPPFLIRGQWHHARTVTGAMPKSQGKKGGKKANARMFRQDLVHGKGKMNGKPESAGASAAAENGRYVDEVLEQSSAYYEQKDTIEAKLGPVLSNDEFERDYFQMPDESKIISGTSIFDPVLCELAYRWFCPIGGLVFDPLAGGSVRGIVAAKLNRRYISVDLSERQLSRKNVFERI